MDINSILTAIWQERLRDGLIMFGIISLFITGCTSFLFGIYLLINKERGELLNEGEIEKIEETIGK